MVLLFLLVIVAVIGLRLTSGDDRKQLLEKGLALLRELAIVAREEYQRQEPLRARLRQRTRFAIVTPLLAAVTVAVFILMLFGAGSMGDISTLIGWGASFGPRTTNGEWWRLLTATFVHTGFFRMAIEVTAVVQLGMLLERLTGRATLATVFCGAAVIGSLVNVSMYPMGITNGTSGAIFGLYGLLLAAIARSFRARPEVPPQAGPLGIEAAVRAETEAIEGSEEAPAVEQPVVLVLPKSALLWLAPITALFVLSLWSNDSFAFRADLAGFAVGLVAGLVVTGGIAHDLPQPKIVAITSAVTAVVLVGCAVPLRGIADVRPEIARIIALEDSTTGVYQAALARLNKGKIKPDELAQVIDRSIVPELEAADTHLLSIKGVPPEHRGLVKDADEYLKLRSASWRLHAESWRNKVRARKQEAAGTLTSDASWQQTKAQFRAEAATRGKAEGTERASLEVLQRLKGARAS